MYKIRDIFILIEIEKGEISEISKLDDEILEIVCRRTNSINVYLSVSLICPSACILELVVGQQGPVFVLEPPSTLVFSNTTGSQLSCSAHGSPTPHVTWITSPDQRSVTAVPGLR